MTNNKKLSAVRHSEISNSLEQFKKYIRVRSADEARFVEFDFAIDDPSLFVELVLPKQAFKEFCEKNNVIFMSVKQMDANDKDSIKWRYGDETLVSNNHDR
ncbi:phenol hydroxylase subunit [Dasania marina]|uniref:phenol hydroxylase subunit n=1 Tax=Dasania marina TaxID=471499 RepID=UPI0003678B99|nr:phenol hydroxylase subunit [Dasania marina]